ncbi:MAG: glycosyltransferase [Pseudomonadota bacterium]
MRIVLLTNLIPPYRKAVYTAFANRLAQEGGMLHIITTQAGEPQRDWPLVTGPYAQTRLPGLALPLGENRVLMLNTGLVTALKAARPDIVIIAGFGPAQWRAAFWCKANHVPYIVQSDGWSGSERIYANLLRRRVRRYLISGATAAIAAGSKGADWFVRSGMEPHRVVIAPIPASFAVPVLIAAPVETRRFDLLWCGRPTPSKGFEDFLRIAAGLRDCHSVTALHIVGIPDDDVITRKAIARYGLHDICTISPQVAPHRLPAIYQSARLFLLPSHNDAYGVAVIEAMQSGTVALASDQTGCAHDVLMAGETMLPVGEIDIWVEKCAALLRNSTTWHNTRTTQHTATAHLTPQYAADQMWRACALPERGDLS